MKHITCYECFPPRSGKHYFLAGKLIHTRTDCPPNTIYFLNKSDMKPLKKHPKQQRMEEMTFPIIKPFKFYGAHDGTYGTSGGNLMGCEHGVDKRTICTQCENKVTMTGREWLRSINDDNGFTLMPRLVWRVVAVVILVIICLVVIL